MRRVSLTIWRGQFASTQATQRKRDSSNGINSAQDDVPAQMSAGGPGLDDLTKSRRGCPRSLAIGDRGYQYDSGGVAMTESDVCTSHLCLSSPRSTGRVGGWPGCRRSEVSSPTNSGCPGCLALGHPGYRYDASTDFNSSARYIYDDSPRVSAQRSVRPSVNFYRQRAGYQIRHRALQRQTLGRFHNQCA